MDNQETHKFEILVNGNVSIETKDKLDKILEGAMDKISKLGLNVTGIRYKITDANELTNQEE